jgi:carboxyl-terminal processing protease
MRVDDPMPMRSLLVVSLAFLTGCVTKPTGAPPKASSEPVAVYSIPAPPSPNPFAKPKPAPDAAAGATSQDKRPDLTKDPAAKSIAAAYGRIKHDYMDRVDEGRLDDGCSRSMLELVAPAGGPSPEPKKSEGGLAGLREIITTVDDVRNRSQGKLDDGSIADACIRGMVQTLERSEYLDKDEFRELQVGTGDIAGVGIEFESKAVPLVVVSAIEGGPASTSALKGGDLITAIDGVPLAPLTVKDAVKRLRGKPGSTVTLSVERPGNEETFRLTLTRAVIRLESVKWRMLPSGYAYVRISQFNVGTLKRFASAITEAYGSNDGTLSGLILDLRDNTGGLLNVCVGVATAFLSPDRLVAETVGRAADSKLRLYSSKAYYVRGDAEDPLAAVPSSIKRIPVAVLMNRKSASGSEIIAAALQHYGRAQVIGERSAGSDIIQSIFPLDGGSALQLATARLYRPGGMPLGTTGIEPDVSVAVTRVYPIGEIADDPVVRAALGALTRP